MSLFRPLALLVIAAMPCLAVADNLPVYSTGVYAPNLVYPLSFPWRVDGVYQSTDELFSYLFDAIITYPAARLNPDPSWKAQPTYNPDPSAANWINSETDASRGCITAVGTGDLYTIYDGSLPCASELYLYQPVFDLSGFLYNTLDISGRFAADNAVWLYANTGGGRYGYEPVASAPYGPPYSYDYWTSFDLKGAEAANFFFIVQNGNGPNDPDSSTGLIVDITSATGSPVPEPSSFALFGTGLLLLFGLTKRRLLQP